MASLANLYAPSKIREKTYDSDRFKLTTTEKTLLDKIIKDPYSLTAFSDKKNILDSGCCKGIMPKLIEIMERDSKDRVTKTLLQREILPEIAYLESGFLEEKNAFVTSEVTTERLFKGARENGNPHFLQPISKDPEHLAKTHVMEKFVSYFMWLAVDKGLIPADQDYGFFPKATKTELRHTPYAEHELYYNDIHYFYLRDPQGLYQLQMTAPDNTHFSVSDTRLKKKVGADKNLDRMFLLTYNPDDPSEQPTFVEEGGLVCRLERQSEDKFLFVAESYSGNHGQNPYKSHATYFVKPYSDKTLSENKIASYLNTCLPEEHATIRTQSNLATLFLPCEFHTSEDEAFASFFLLEMLKKAEQDSSPEFRKNMKKIMGLLNEEGTNFLDGPAPRDAITSSDSSSDSDDEPKGATKDAPHADSEEDILPKEAPKQPEKATEAEAEKSLDDWIESAEYRARQAFAERMVAEINASEQSPQNGKASPTTNPKPKKPQQKATVETEDLERMVAEINASEQSPQNGKASPPTDHKSKKPKHPKGKGKGKGKKPQRKVTVETEAPDPLTPENLWKQRPEMEEKFAALKKEKFVKFQSFLHIASEVLCTEEADKLLSVSQNGSHLNFHIEGAEGSTLVVPHGKEPSIRGNRAANFLATLSQNLALAGLKKATH